jgi:H+/gluconate symporter-like permease
MPPTDKPLSGTDDQLVTILLAWVFAAILHFAIGSISVAAITAAGRRR